MADHEAPHETSTSSDATPPNHLGTDVPSGHLDEKHGEKGHHGHGFDAAHPVKGSNKAAEAGDDDDEDEDINALIDELESQDGHIDEEEDEEDNRPGGEVKIPENMLQTDTRIGLTDAEVINRRKKFGLNQMKEDKENLILKFLGYFVGPIQFVMEVRDSHCHRQLLVIYRFIASSLVGAGDLLISVFFVADACLLIGGRYPCCWSSGLGRFRCHLCPAPPQRLGRFHPGIPGRFNRRRTEEDPCAEGERTS